MTKPSADMYASTVKELATTMLGVARESVSLVKRSNQQQGMKLKQKQEWDVYIELLRLMYNLIERLSGFYIPIQEQPEFMEKLEDAVIHQLKAVLAPTLSAAEIDDREMTLSMGQIMTESRNVYDRFKFVVTDQTKTRDEFFTFFGERVAEKAGASGNKDLISAAMLCGSAIIPAFKKLFEDSTQTSQAKPGTQQSHPVSPPPASALSFDTAKGQTIKLVRVVSRISGEEVETWWGVHPRFQRDLQPQELKELSQHMNRVTRILGERFSVVATKLESPGGNQSIGGDQPVGHA